MTLPIIISYSQANLNSIGPDAQTVLKKLSGKHSCQFHYNEPQKGHTKVRIVVQGVEWSIIVEIGRDYLCFENPWFRKSRTMEPIKEDDGVIKECDIVFIDKRISPITKLIDMGNSSCLAEIREHILKCSRLKRPIVPLHTEKEREIWSAYCDGLNALNKERRNFITLDYVGTPILYNDTRAGEMYTVKLGIGADSLENVPKRVEGMLNDKYRINKVEFNDEQTELVITCKGTEKILEDDLDKLSEFLHDYGFSMPFKGIVNVLRASVSCTDLKERADLYDKLDALLEQEGIIFTNNESLEYTLQSDEDAERFIDIASEVFGELGIAVQANNIPISLELGDDRKAFKALIFSEDKIGSSENLSDSIWSL